MSRVQFCKAKREIDGAGCVLNADHVDDPFASPHGFVGSVWYQAIPKGLEGTVGSIVTPEQIERLQEVGVYLRWVHKL